jgi:hypothetical protein
MHAFIYPSKQLRQKVREATLRSLHHTSLCRRLILTAKARGARTASVGTALHSRIRNSPSKGITILKFLYGQLYNGKLASRYGLAPTDACPLCGLPDSCTHIAGQCIDIYRCHFLHAGTRARICIFEPLVGHSTKVPCQTSVFLLTFKFIYTGRLVAVSCRTHTVRVPYAYRTCIFSVG